MYKETKVLVVRFQNRIKQHELIAFRGAIASHFPNHVLFHNHHNDQNDQLRYAYPLIQYKIIGGKAAIICINEGIEDMYRFFSEGVKKIHLYDREITLEVDSIFNRNFKMQVWDTLFRYSIKNWVALNQKNYSIFQEMTEKEQKEFLEKKLIGNMLSMAKGIDWHVEKPIEVQVKDYMLYANTFKGIKLITIDADIQTNVFIPHYLGLGGKVGFGKGTIFPFNKKEQAEQNKLCSIQQ